jgi:signal transduction histidine kinase
MDSAEPSTLAVTLAARQRAARTELTSRWLERIAARVSVDPERVFPTDDLLDHMPSLIAGIADFVEHPDSALASQAEVMDRAMALGALRHAQGFSEHELQKEYEILGGILFAFFARVAEETHPSSQPAELLGCAHRLFQAIARVQQATTMQYVRHATAELREREERLRAFQRALTHELRNRIGAMLGAGQLLELPDIPPAQREELAGVVVRNAEGMRLTLDNLIEIAQPRIAPRQQRHVRLAAAAAEAARQLRDAADRAGVEVRIAADLPDVEVSAAAVELCLVNYIANAIKYSDRGKAKRWVAVRGRLARAANGLPTAVVVEVADNGIGVPEEVRAQLFTRFFRAHEEAEPTIQGTGLGLSIVREVVETLGGRAWAEFRDGESIFAFALPCRRDADAPRADQPITVD